jgi:hypothetical protein
MTFSFPQAFADIRSFIYGGISTLPLTLAGTFFILGFMTSNYAHMFFLLGFLVVVPITQTILSVFIDWLFTLLNVPTYLYKVHASDLCGIQYPLSSTGISSRNVQQYITAVPSLWMSMIIFFFSYILMNAITLYKEPSTTPNSEDKHQFRTSQAMLSIISITIIALIIIIMRFMSTKCETWMGLLITIPVFSSLGYAWFQFISQSGSLRLADLFGIANRLLSPSSVKNEPVACLPVA